MWHCHVHYFYCFWTVFWPYCCFWTVFGLDLGRAVDLLRNVTTSSCLFWAKKMTFWGMWQCHVWCFGITVWFTPVAHCKVSGFLGDGHTVSFGLCHGSASRLIAFFTGINHCYNTTFFTDIYHCYNNTTSRLLARQRQDTYIARCKGSGFYNHGHTVWTGVCHGFTSTLTRQ